jgi:hypothetical protein
MRLKTMLTGLAFAALVTVSGCCHHHSACRTNYVAPANPCCPPPANPCCPQPPVVAPVPPVPGAVPGAVPPGAIIR